jgi:formate/nitrite transporter FocA (FNT family)
MPDKRDIEERIREERDKTRWSDSERADDELVDAVVHPPSEGLAVSDIFSLDEIFTRVLATAEDELAATNGVLFWSGLAAGLALGLSFIARTVFASLAPADSNGLGYNLFYPIGFILIVLGRYQLFTENTLTPVTLVLTRLAGVRGLLRVWSLVYLANMVGAILISLLLAHTRVFAPEAITSAFKLGFEALSYDWTALFSKAVIAGWLVAALVWLVHSVTDGVSRIILVWMIMYLIGAAGLYHCITSSVEVFYVAFKGGTDFWQVWPRFVLPVTLGNVVGGVVFVAILNYAQFGKEQGGFGGHRRKLPWFEWLAGKRGK